MNKLFNQRITLAKGKCEVQSEYCTGRAATCHHCYQGRKQRKISERIETLRAVCNECHAYLHGQGFETLQRLQVEACQELIKKIGEEETRGLLGKLYF